MRCRGRPGRDRHRRAHEPVPGRQPGHEGRLGRRPRPRPTTSSCTARCTRTTSWRPGELDGLSPAWPPPARRPASPGWATSRTSPDHGVMYAEHIHLHSRLRRRHPRHAHVHRGDRTHRPGAGHRHGPPNGPLAAAGACPARTSWTSWSTTSWRRRRATPATPAGHDDARPVRAAVRRRAMMTSRPAPGVPALPGFRVDGRGAREPRSPPACSADLWAWRSCAARAGRRPHNPGLLSWSAARPAAGRAVGARPPAAPPMC